MLAQQHQEAKKNKQKYWHDRHIKNKNINAGDFVLRYEIWIKGKP
jgi:hypothetical protein